MKLSTEDLKRVEDLWEKVITPACVQLEKETGKAAEAFLEAIIAGIEGRVVKRNNWNAFERIWWNNRPPVEDTKHARELLFHCGIPPSDQRPRAGKLHDECHAKYQRKRKSMKNKEERSKWTNWLQVELASLKDFDPG